MEDNLMYSSKISSSENTLCQDKSISQEKTTHPQKAVFHILCGKIASGKSTLSAQLSQQPMTIVMNEDYWLSTLYGSEIKTVADYVCYSEKLRNAMEPHLISLLNAGISVILDFPANTIENRKWMKKIIEATEVENYLHFLDVPDSVCLARLHLRNQSGEHQFSVTDEQFAAITRAFVAPQEEEGFNIVLHGNKEINL
ncbi:AAA family ATPase [Xenorhabdus sp. KK7.4]|uniref:AAA family ATPase n=1 Tax=Xenorhabdus sp. KK7.4 TaxID=1851572 RepID=UPI001F4E6D55|nr:ATP-binding protein [Xenorhabdus sp. KK7.4]